MHYKSHHNFCITTFGKLTGNIHEFYDIPSPETIKTQAKVSLTVDTQVEVEQAQLHFYIVLHAEDFLHCDEKMNSSRLEIQKADV